MKTFCIILVIFNFLLAWVLLIHFPVRNHRKYGLTSYAKAMYAIGIANILIQTACLFAVIL